MTFAQLVASADTVLVQQVSPERSAFEQMVFVASGLTSILGLIAIVAVLVLLLKLRTAATALHDKVDELLVQLRPVAKNANEASAHVREASTMAKEMVAETRDTVSQANAQVRASIAELTYRVDELTSMVAKATSTAARVGAIATTALGGLKAGARIFGIGGRGKKSRPSIRVREAEERPRLRPRR